jgi:Protein of unknown function (DUF3386)
MTKTAWMPAVLVLAAVASWTAVRAGDDTRARKMMEEAFNNRYRWSEGFKGFSADFALTREGKTWKGNVKANVTKPRGGVTVECADEDVKKLVGDTLASTVTHTRASTFDKGFGSCSFAIAGEGAHGGTKIAVADHAFFKDFTVKDGNFVENHGGQGAMSSEVKVQQLVWLAECGKTLPRAYAFTIKNGDREQSGKNEEAWSKVEGVWLPTWCRLVRKEGSTPVESILRLENIKVEQAAR